MREKFKIGEWMFVDVITSSEKTKLVMETSTAIVIII